MLSATADFIRALVRPAVTAGFVGAIIYMAVFGHVEAAVTGVLTLGGVAVNAWFTDRSKQPSIVDEPKSL